MESHPLIPLTQTRESFESGPHQTLLEPQDTAKTEQQVESTSISNAQYPQLPPFDRSLTTNSSRIAGLGLSSIAIIGSLISGIYVLQNPNNYCFYQVSLPTAGAEASSLVANILVALLTDSMGYLHATTLRWALYREDRLEFNTNIRLFKSARRSAPNKWPANICWVSSLILCYAATSQMFVRGTIAQDSSGTLYTVLDEPLVDAGTNDTYVNGVAVSALAIGLFGQATLSSWCFFSASKLVSTWSSNSLNNCLALLHGNLEHKSGRCMLSVHQKDMADQPTRPSKQQKSARLANRSVVYVVWFVWALAILALIWAVVLVLVSRNTILIYGGIWALTPSWFTEETNDGSGNYLNSVPLDMTPDGNNIQSTVYFPWGVQVTLGIFFVFAIQGAQTIGLHCIELLVNISRDEDAWRRAYPEKREHSQRSREGARLSSNAFKSAASSWQNVVLFVSKALLHWLLGQSLLVNITVYADLKLYQFDMIYMRVFVFALLATSLAIFTTYLAFRRPKGCQPAAWGHFQVLADLVDDWSVSSKGYLF